MKVREYPTYADYLKHQKAKTLTVKDGTCTELGPFERRCDGLRCLFAPVTHYIKPGGRVLCLGARRGEEVQAWRDWGYEAVGIDLVPFEPLVVEGDFHNLSFGCEFDLVYSNSIDHVLDLKALVAEITRVLKPGGFVLLHLAINCWSDEMSLAVDSIGELLTAFAGFEMWMSGPLPEFRGEDRHLLLLRKLA